MKVQHPHSTLFLEAMENPLVGQTLREARAEFAKKSTLSFRQQREGLTQTHIREFGVNNTVPNSHFFDNVEKAHSILHGVGSDSFFDFVISLHSLGFSLFSKADDAFYFKTNMEIEHLLTEWRSSISTSHIEAFDVYSPHRLLNLLNLNVRGKSDQLDEAVLFQKVLDVFTGLRSTTSESINAFLNNLVSSLLAKYSTWAELKGDVVGATELVDACFNDWFNASVDSVPLIEHLIEAKQNKDPDFKFATVAFDGNRPDTYANELQVRFLGALCGYIGVYGQSDLAFLKQKVITQNGNGLSWLLNKGIKLFASADLKKLQQGLGVPKKHLGRLKTLVQLARNVDYAPLAIFDKSIPKNVRGELARRLDKYLVNFVEFKDALRVFHTTRYRQLDVLEQYKANLKDLATVQEHYEKPLAQLLSVIETGKNTAQLAELLGEYEKVLAELKTNYAGMKQLRKNIAKKLNRRNNLITEQNHQVPTLKPIPINLSHRPRDTFHFRYLTENAIFYGPKDKDWVIPSSFYKKYRWVFERAEVQGEVINGQRLVEVVLSLYQAGELSADDTATILSQSPHRWYVQAYISGIGVQALTLEYNDGDIGKLVKRKHLVQLKLSRHNQAAKAALYGMLSNVKASPPLLCVHKADKDGRRKLSFKVPFTTSLQNTVEQHWSPEHVLGIDPGEYGMGVSLCTLSGELVDSAFISMPGIKTFIQRTSNEALPYSDKNNLLGPLVGRVTAVVDSLMLKLNAVPIFEYHNGRSWIDKLWRSVQFNFAYSKTESDNLNRYTHWFGAERWHLPSTSGEVMVYPGFTVMGKGSSTTCSQCGRDAYSELATMLGERDSVHIEDHIAHVYSGDIRVDLSDDLSFVDNTLETTPEHVKCLLGDTKARVRPKDAENGRYDVFKCLFVDCGHTEHADTNAAVNIAREYLDKVQIKP